MKPDIKHIHMLGICGTGMASLAGLLVERGYIVTGSDHACYPPMDGQLEALGIKPKIGYSAKNLRPKPGLVIVGNVIRKDNSEAKEVLMLGIPYLSMPQAIKEFFLKDRDSVVITGTHGKTTTANIVAWLLDHAGAAPGFMIGGIGINFGASYRSPSGRYFVIEGDEYDTAFFDKGPKFLHYDPKYAVMGSIEFDHADIYKDIGHVKDAFSKFIAIIQSDGICAVNADDKNIYDILYHAHCKVVTYGFSDHADYRIVDCRGILRSAQNDSKLRTPHNDLQSFTMSCAGKMYKFETPQSGKHNLLNAAAAVTLLIEMGFDAGLLAEGLKLFKGVRRRQEVRGIINSITVIDDFAHHPTAILETIKAMKLKYGEKRLWAIFEPRSNTTRRKVFEKEMAESLKGADRVIIADVFHGSDIPKGERLNPEKVADAVNASGTEAHFISKTDYIIEFVVRNVLPGDIILIMSNGPFDDIHNRLIDCLKRRRFQKSIGFPLSRE